MNKKVPSALQLPCPSILRGLGVSFCAIMLHNSLIFNYTFLRNAFRTVLLNEMEAKIGSSFKKVKSRCYREHKEGFYVYAKPNKCDPKTVAKYIGRYLGRPVIATSWKKCTRTSCPVPVEKGHLHDFHKLYSW